jgi:arsenite methyltransferase
MNGLQFTDEAAQQLEKAYLTRDVIAQRSETIRHLSVAAGERVLDIECGHGWAEATAKFVARLELLKTQYRIKQQR